MKKKLIFVLLLFIYGCGYVPIHSGIEKNDLKIVILSEDGDAEMNNMIKNQIKIFSISASDNIYNIKLQTSFDKKIISKDATGTATNYKINTKINFAFNKNNKEYKINFDENFNVKNISNTYEQANYEKTVIENFTRSAVDNLMIKLMSIDDN